MQATDYNSYTAYTTAKANLGLQVIPQELFDSLKSQDRMIAQFKSDMLGFIALAENKEADGSINWNFIDADMYVKWSVLLEGEEYTNWFDAAADALCILRRLGRGLSRCNPIARQSPHALYRLLSARLRPIFLIINPPVASKTQGCPNTQGLAADPSKLHHPPGLLYFGSRSVYPIAGNPARHRPQAVCAAPQVIRGSY